MVIIARCSALPPVATPLPESLEDALIQCAHGQAAPDVALMQLLVVSDTEEQGERALGTAIWDALENREAPKAERLGAMQKLWDSARNVADEALGYEPAAQALP